MPDISTTYNSFGGGISDDSFIGSTNSVADMESIDVQSNDRFAEAGDVFIRTNEADRYGGDYTWVKSTQYGAFRGNTSETLRPNGSQASGIVGSPIYTMEFYGTGSDQVNYFFGTTTAKKTNNDATTLLATISSGYPTENTPVTAVGWHQANILFSKLNKLYYLSTTTDTCFPAITLPPGSVVKCIYAYSLDSIVVMTVNGFDTIAYELAFNGTTYSLVSEVTDINTACIDAVGDKYNIYWISTRGLHMYQGRQFSDGPVKSISLGSGAKISKGAVFVNIVNGLDLYRFGKMKPGRSNILTRYDLGFSATGIDRDIVLTNAGVKSALFIQTDGYKRTSIVTLRPLDGGSYEVPKHSLSYRFGYILPRFSSYSNPATRCGIRVRIMTDEMERVNTTATVTIGEYSEDGYGYIEIPPNVVATALETAGYRSEFGYVRTYIDILSGDEYTSPIGVYRKTPKLFDFTIQADYVKR